MIIHALWAAWEKPPATPGDDYYKIDYKDEPVYFDKEEKLNKEKMLGLIKKLIVRLEQINDGSFVIDDRETERIRNL